jgi:hypothetical protein
MSTPIEPTDILPPVTGEGHGNVLLVVACVLLAITVAGLYWLDAREEKRVKRLEALKG